MRRIPPRRQVWLSLGVLVAAVPASVLASVLWSGEDTAQQTTVTRQAPTPEATDLTGTPSSSGKVGDSDEATRSSTPEPTTTPPAPSSEVSAEPAAPAPVAADEPEPVPAADSGGMSREEMIRSRVMTPHPRPPMTPNISPDIQRQIEEAEEDVIDLGTIYPEGQGPSQEYPHPYRP